MRPYNSTMRRVQKVWMAVRFLFGTATGFSSGNRWLRSSRGRPAKVGSKPTALRVYSAYSLLFSLLITLLPFPLFADSFEPTASFFATPSSGDLTTTFSFDASASEDIRGFSNTLQYRWNFDYSGSGSFGEWGPSPRTTTRYTAVGNKTVALEVKDTTTNLTDRTFASLKVNATRIFDSWFTVSPLEGTTTTQFTFTAQISTTSGGTPIDQYEVRWDFNGDNTWDTDFSTAKTAFHVYPTTGYFNPKLEVRSPTAPADTLVITGYDDNDDNETSLLFVTFGPAPQASVSIYPANGTPQTTFYFDGSKSFDQQDHRVGLQYRWDFEGNGTFEVDWGTELYPTHQYPIPGTYHAILQVKDTDGNTDEANVEIEVRSDNLPPVAGFTVSSDNGLTDKSLGTTNTTFTFNASTSRDEEDTANLLQVRWDFDGDGVWDTNFDPQKIAEHRYLDPGVYTVKVQVVDSENQRDTEEVVITVVANDAPVPSLKVTPGMGTSGTEFTFDASGSTDSQYQATVLEVRWDWDGNGTWDTPFERGKIVKHSYEKKGNYKVKMQLRDPEGTVSETQVSVTVLASTAPQASLTADLATGTYSTLFHFDASGSMDDQTRQDQLLFRWDFNYTGENDILYDTAWSKAMTQARSFKTVGPHSVRVEVKDIDGDAASAVITVNVHWASEYLDFLKSRGIIQGYAGGDLAPDKPVSRAELLKMVMQAHGFQNAGTVAETSFKDVSKTDWFVRYVESAADLGIAEGYADGTFRPNAQVNRAEAMKILLKAFDVPLTGYEGTFYDVGQNDWFAIYVGTAYELGLVGGYADGSFRPGNSMTRGEAAKIIALGLQAEL